MALKSSSPATVFAKALRSFETGGLNYSDFLAEIRELLRTGASPTELRESLRARESIEPLSDTAHVEVLRILDDAVARESTESPGTSAETAASSSALTSGPSSDARAAQFASSKLEAAAVARAAALAAEMAVVRAALEVEQNKNRETARALADRIASTEAARALAEDALSDSERHQADARQLRESAATRDAALAQAQRMLAERDAQLTALTQQHARLAPALEARAKSAAQLQAELHATRTLHVESQQETARLRTESQSLREALTAREAKLAALTEEQSKAPPARSAGGTPVDGELHAARSRVTSLVADLAAARTAFEAEQRKAQESYDALTDRIESAEGARARAEAALRESENFQAEARSLRTSLAARDAQFAALTQDHAKLLATHESRAADDAHAVSMLQNARARADEALREAQHAQTEARRLRDMLKARESEIAALHREQARSAAAHAEAVVESLHDTQVLEAPPPIIEEPMLDTRVLGTQALDTQALELSEPRPQSEEIDPLERARLDLSDLQPSVPPERFKARPPLLSGRALALGAVVILAVVAAWFMAHRAAAPIKAETPAPTPPIVPETANPGTMFRDCPTCPAMTIVPAGRFKQGSASAAGAAANETPQHWVIIGRPFAMSTDAVTVDEFGRFIAATARDMRGCDTYDGTWQHRPEKNWKDPGFSQTGMHPVTCVSFNDAEAYAKWLSAETGFRYRLPSASEWEYAARAGAEVAQPWSPNEFGACAFANVADRSAVHRYPGWQIFPCDDGYVNTSPVGSFKPNPFGLSDMLGNVFQWTQDCWHSDYVGAPVDGSARTDGTCAARELRGGSWFSSPAYVRVNYRNHFAVDYRTSSVGIRLVRVTGP